MRRKSSHENVINIYVKVSLSTIEHRFNICMYCGIRPVSRFDLRPFLIAKIMPLSRFIPPTAKCGQGVGGDRNDVVMANISAQLCPKKMGWRLLEGICSTYIARGDRRMVLFESNVL